MPQGLFRYSRGALSIAQRVSRTSEEFCLRRILYLYVQIDRQKSVDEGDERRESLHGGLFSGSEQGTSKEHPAHKLRLSSYSE